MRLLVDTNVFIASSTDESDRGETATELLNADHEFTTTVLSLMELRSVLIKKKRPEQSTVEGAIDDIWTHVAVYTPEPSDQVAAYERQRESLLYTVDCLLLETADDLDAELVTFDAELLDHGASSPTTFV